MQWARPEWLWALVPVLIYPWFVLRSVPAVPVPDATAAGARPVDRLIAIAPVALRSLVLLSLVLALAGMRSPAGVIEEREEGVPIVVAVDVSSSMLARDWRCSDPSCAGGGDAGDRLTAARRTIESFVRARERDPIGLVAFAGEALTVVPVTRLRPVLLGALATLDVGLLEDGTAIGEGLATAANRVRRVPGADRVVILMSDGASNAGRVDPLVAARAAAGVGVRVYTIGIGSPGTAPVPVRRGPRGFEYAERPVAVDETLLRRIAATAGGEYFRAENPEALDRVYARIDRLVRAPIETRRRVLYREWFPALVSAAAGLLAAEWLLRGSRWGVLP